MLASVPAPQNTRFGERCRKFGSARGGAVLRKDSVVAKRHARVRDIHGLREIQENFLKNLEASFDARQRSETLAADAEGAHDADAAPAFNPWRRRTFPTPLGRTFFPDALSRPAASV